MMICSSIRMRTFLCLSLQLLTASGCENDVNMIVIRVA